jgi:gliding motility-associated-like protein
MRFALTVGLSLNLPSFKFTKSMKTLILIFSLFLTTQLSAQVNLMPDGGFEKLINCQGIPDGRFEFWYWANAKSTAHQQADTCGRHINNFFPGNPPARSGQKYAYITTYTSDPALNGRDFIFAPFWRTLTAGKKYYFEMYCRVETHSSNASSLITNNQAAFFSENCFCDSTIFTRGLPNIATSPQILNLAKIINTQWTRVAGCFTAKGSERFVTIGNFNEDRSTTTAEIASTGTIPIKFSVYRIDDVALYDLEIPLKDTTVCSGDSVAVNIGFEKLDATYTWNDGVKTPQRFLKNAGKYTVTITIEDGCTIEKSMELTLLPTRAEWSSRDTAFCETNKNIVLRAVKETKETKITWSTGSNLPAININQAGLFWVKLLNRCVTRTDSINVQLVDCTLNAFVPNAFSPNDDGINDVFRPFFKANALNITQYQMQIYNRWGDLLFTSDDINKGWDGKMNGKLLPPDTYVWLIRYKAEGAAKVEQKTLSGDVNLLR